MNTQQVQQHAEPSKVDRLTALYRAYCPEQDQNAPAKQMAAAVQATAAYKKAFARVQDPDKAAREMAMQTTSNVEIPAWLIDGDYEKFDFKKVGTEWVKKAAGHGAFFLLPDGTRRFVNMDGPLTPAAPTFAEFVFPEGDRILNLMTGEVTYGQPPSGSRPLLKTHHIDPPATDLANELKAAFKFQTKKGCISGEPFDLTLAVLTITEDKDAIKFFPADDKKPAALHYTAADRNGQQCLVKDDPEQACQKLGFSQSTPVQIWRDTLAGQPIVANGKLSIFTDRTDTSGFWGPPGTLAALAAQMQAEGRMIPHKTKPGVSQLSFTEPSKLTRAVVDEATGKEHEAQVECLPVGDKWLYRLETYPENGGGVGYKGYARADQEFDRNGKPVLPTLECIVKSGVSKGTGKDYTMNEGAFVNYTNFAIGKPLPKGSEYAGFFDV